MRINPYLFWLMIAMSLLLCAMTIARDWSGFSTVISDVNAALGGDEDIPPCAVPVDWHVEGPCWEPLDPDNPTSAIVFYLDGYTLAPDGETRILPTEDDEAAGDSSP